jgi:hypothetical protein
MHAAGSLQDWPQLEVSIQARLQMRNKVPNVMCCVVCCAVLCCAVPCCCLCPPAEATMLSWLRLPTPSLSKCETLRRPAPCNDKKTASLYPSYCTLCCSQHSEDRTFGYCVHASEQQPREVKQQASLHVSRLHSLRNTPAATPNA